MRFLLKDTRSVVGVPRPDTRMRGMQLRPFPYCRAHIRNFHTTYLRTIMVSSISAFKESAVAYFILRNRVLPYSPYQSIVQ